MIDNNLIKLINVLYQLGMHLNFISKIGRGYLSDNYILGNREQKFFLKKYSITNELHLKNIHEVKTFFAGYEIPVILPIKNSLNSTYFEYLNSFYCIFPFVTGNQYERCQINTRAIKGCGEMLAKIHLIGKRFHINSRKSNLYLIDKDKFILDSSIIENKLSKLEIKNRNDVLAFKLLKLKIETSRKFINFFDKIDLSCDHLIHGDFHEDNIFFTNDDEIKHIFDWEKTELAPRSIEIARSIDIMFFYGNYKSENYSNAIGFLDSYKTEYPIDNEELIAGINGWFLNQVHDLWLLEQSYLKNNNRTVGLLDIEHKLIKYYSFYLHEHINKLLMIK